MTWIPNRAAEQKSTAEEEFESTLSARSNRRKCHGYAAVGSATATSASRPAWGANMAACGAVTLETNPARPPAPPVPFAAHRRTKYSSAAMDHADEFESTTEAVPDHVGVVDRRPLVHRAHHES